MGGVEASRYAKFGTARCALPRPAIGRRQSVSGAEFGTGITAAQWVGATAGQRGSCRHESGFFASVGWRCKCACSGRRRHSGKHLCSFASPANCDSTSDARRILKSATALPISASNGSKQRQLLTAVASTGELVDPSCSDPNNGSGQTLTGTSDNASLNTGGSTVNCASTGGTSADAAIATVAKAAPAPAIPDAARPQTSTLSGYVFSESTAGLGDFDPAEPAAGEDPLAGVTVTLFDNDTRVEPVGRDRARRLLQFFEPRRGQLHDWRDHSARGHQRLPPSSAAKRAASAMAAKSKKSNCRPRPTPPQTTFPRSSRSGSVSGTAFIEPSLGSPDYNAGNPAAGELPLPGATVELSTASGTEIGTTTTDANGTYNFANLSPNLPLIVHPDVLVAAPPPGRRPLATMVMS